jgi:hypothetical protein
MLDEFFPTPNHIIQRLWEALGTRNCVLEPSAGHGAIVDWAVQDAKDNRYYRRFELPSRIDVIESDLERQLVLRGKAYNLVSDDFLGFVPTRRYDGIIMNPPFSHGAQHCLRAWEILAPGGRLVCLLNAETVRNPYTRERQVLAQALADHGEVRELGACFNDRETVRRTGVEVVMVVLNKAKTDPEFGFFDGLTAEAILPDVGVPISEVQAIMEPDTIRDLVDQYNQALAAYRDVLRAKNRVVFYGKPVAGIEAGDVLSTSADDTAAYNAFIDRLSAKAWEQIFTQTDIARFVTRGVREDWEAFQAQSQRAAFTIENIQRLLQTLGSNVGNILEEALLRCFDALTKYDKTNRVHWEGWKSNDTWRINRRMVIPYILDPNWAQWGPSLYWGPHQEIVADLDRVLCNLTGQKQEKIVTVINALRAVCETKQWNQPCESTFFEIKYHKKGTVHLIWKDQELLDRFNAAAAKGKNWLPGDR